VFYIGIDQSLTSTGIVILDEDAKIFASTIINSKEKGVKRLSDLSKKITEYLKNYNPPKMIKIFIEGYSFGSRLGQAFSIGEWGGVLRKSLYELGYNIAVIPPTSLKKFITGKGNAKKELMLKEVFKKYNVDFTDNNLADAYGLARMAWSIDKQSKLLNYEKEAIKAITL